MNTPSAKVFNYTIDATIETAQDGLAKFKASLDDDPAYAFEWGTDAVQAAANLKVATKARKLMDTLNDVAAVQQALADEVGYLVRLEGSTSPLSNLVEQATAVATMRFAGLKR